MACSLHLPANIPSEKCLFCDAAKAIKEAKKLLDDEYMSFVEQRDAGRSVDETIEKVLKLHGEAIEALLRAVE